MFQGTSMSSPMVSGVVALLLEANPQLTPPQVKDILAETAIVDSYTGVIPATGSTTWGFGKVNAYAALKRTLETVGITHYPSPLSCMLYPNPGSGSYFIQLNSDKTEQMEISVFDVNENSVSVQKWNVVAGTNTTSVSLNDSSAGIYIVKVTSSGRQATVRVVKN
jgi:hypothetical protein